MNEQIKKAITSDSKSAKTMKSLIRGVTNKENWATFHIRLYVEAPYKYDLDENENPKLNEDGHKIKTYSKDYNYKILSSSYK